MNYVLLVDGFEEIEAIEPIDILRRGGVEVKTVGVYGKKVTGSHNITVEADVEIDEVSAEDMELIMLPGGPGHTGIEKSEQAKELILAAVKKNCWLAAICAAPSVLGKMGLLSGKRVTCFPGYEKFLSDSEVTGSKVEVDGRVITAKGAGAAGEFGFAMLTALKGKETAEQIRSVMQY